MAKAPSGKSVDATSLAIPAVSLKQREKLQKMNASTRTILATIFLRVEVCFPFGGYFEDYFLGR